MAKFKVGDKVRVKADTLRDSDYRKKYVGKVLTIRTINPNGRFFHSTKGSHYGFDSPATGWVFHDCELEPVGFTKADLKNGMVVETYEECADNRYVILGDKLLQNKHMLELRRFNDDLTRNDGFEKYGVAKIYESNAESLQGLFKDSRLTLIWERPSEPIEELHKEMTVEEIEKELGYKIKVVGKEV